MDDARARALDLLNRRRVLVLSTADREGPWAAPVFFAADGFRLYFVSDPASRHGRAIGRGAAVAGAVTGDFEDWQDIEGLQLEGFAAPAGGAEHEARARAVYLARFPFAAAFLDPVGPFYERAGRKVTWYALDVRRLWLTDNRLGFGTRLSLDWSLMAGARGRMDASRAEGDFPMARAPTRPVRFTYRDSLQLPEGERRELIGGEFHAVPAPTPEHQRISARLERVLQDFVDARGLGEVLHAPLDLVLSEADVVQPDILFISRERAGIVTPTHVSAAPDLVVEILTPGTAERDRGVKRRLYFKYGVREYWLVDPVAGAIEVWVPGEADFELHRAYTAGMKVISPLLPGLAVAVDAILPATGPAAGA